jgi:hypothetical protein
MTAGNMLMLNTIGFILEDQRMALSLVNKLTV